MYGDLTDAAIDQMLRSHHYGRLAFSLGEKLYIVPINYGYDGSKLYGHAAQGTKIRGMRQDPHVAFAIDEINDAAHWRSVLVHGRYVELYDPAEKRRAYQHILAQAGGGERSEVTWAIDLDDLVLFTIEIQERSGRFEQRQAMSLGPVQRIDTRVAVQP